jgi:hypothetical protein
MRNCTLPTDEKNSSRSLALTLCESCMQKTVLASLSSGVNSSNLEKTKFRIDFTSSKQQFYFSRSLLGPSTSGEGDLRCLSRLRLRLLRVRSLLRLRLLRFALLSSLCPRLSLSLSLSLSRSLRSLLRERDLFLLFLLLDTLKQKLNLREHH